MDSVLRLALTKRFLLSLLFAILLWLPVSVNAEQSLRIFYTANVKGFIDPCGCPGAPAGGITRRATFLRQRSDVPSIKLDGGELLGNDTPIDRMRTIYLLRSMQEMGYRTIGVGPRDFLYGREFIEFAADEFGFTLVNTNVVGEDRLPVFAPYAVEEIGDAGLFRRQRDRVRVGIINVIGEDRPPLTQPSDPPVHVTNPVAAAQNAVRELHDQVDIIILMANVSPETLDQLRQIDGIDVILMTRLTRIPGRYVVADDISVIGYSTIEGRGVGQIDVTLSDRTVTRAEGSLTMLLENISEDPLMLQIRQEFENWKERYINELSDQDAFRR